MKAQQVSEDGWGLDNLHQVQLGDPDLGPGQVRVGMKAVSLNYRDLLTVNGLYNPRQLRPLIPCSDGSGEVLEVGPGVTRFKVGDHVCPIFAQAWLSGEPDRAKLKTTLGGPLNGTLCDKPVFHEDGLVRAPSHMDHKQASTLTCAALTAWSALFEQGDLKPGQVLVVQGTGGVSMFALQFGLMAGARVIVTSSSDKKLEFVKSMGAHDTINYKTTPDWGAEVKRLTGRVGADHIVEVGGAGTLNQSLRAIRIGGHISMIGVLSSAAENLSVIPILMQNIRIQGIIVGHREGFEAMNRALETHKIVPHISDEFDFDQSRQAFELMAAGGHMGKIVVNL